MSYSVFAFSGNATSSTPISFTPPAGTNWLIKRFGGGLNVSMPLSGGLDGSLNASVSQVASVFALNEPTDQSARGTINQDGPFIVPSGHSFSIEFSSSNTYTTGYSIGGVTI